jgi:hypothetical protein
MLVYSSSQRTQFRENNFEPKKRDWRRIPSPQESDAVMNRKRETREHRVYIAVLMIDDSVETFGMAIPPIGRLPSCVARIGHPASRTDGSGQIVSCQQVRLSVFS